MFCLRLRYPFSATRQQRTELLFPHSTKLNTETGLDTSRRFPLLAKTFIATCPYTCSCKLFRSGESVSTHVASLSSDGHRRGTFVVRRIKRCEGWIKKERGEREGKGRWREAIKTDLEARRAVYYRDLNDN